MPTPQRNKKKQAKPSTPGRRRPQAAARPRQLQGRHALLQEHVAALRRWIDTGDEAADVLNSAAAFAGRVPVLERCVWDERKLGALHSLKDGLAKQLAVDHRRETQRRAAPAERDAPELNRAADDCLKALNEMLFDELWRKETLLDNALRAVWHEDDDDDAATTTRSAARLWPRTSPESFIDNYFLDVVFTNHDFLI
ncbi:hypothetical protein JL722_14045 [Aureococcus anophagefferens]|nr:hypothetical protein JL722_14045 [Aureococcus anophagefferens]